MSVRIVFRCDICVTVLAIPIGAPSALKTPTGWTTCGTWIEGYYHACSPECLALLEETRGVTPVKRAGSTGR